MQSNESFPKNITLADHMSSSKFSGIMQQATIVYTPLSINLLRVSNIIVFFYDDEVNFCFSNDQNVIFPRFVL